MKWHYVHVTGQGYLYSDVSVAFLYAKTCALISKWYQCTCIHIRVCRYVYAYTVKRAFMRWRLQEYWPSLWCATLCISLHDIRIRFLLMLYFQVLSRGIFIFLLQCYSFLFFFRLDYDAVWWHFVCSCITFNNFTAVIDDWMKSYYYSK